ncbi:MAG: hypothetical protein J6U49_04200 [Alistipes sp.]|nr:hypothetical protein [Alistipes sp.]
MERKLQISDLSIGDWVEIDGEPAKALCLRIAGGHIFKGVSGQMYRCCGGMDFEPIPITPEILEKNGLSFKEFAFEETTMLGRHIRRIAVSKSDRGWWIHVSIRKAGGHDFVDMIFAVDFIGQFVHELQHALRLAGIDKEIELRNAL